MHLACWSDSPAVSHVLISDGGASVSAVDQSGMNCAHFAAAASSSGLIDLLETVERSHGRETMRFFNCSLTHETNFLPLLRALLSTSDSMGRTPLAVSIETGSARAVSALVEDFKAEVNPKDGAQQPLHVACKFGREEIVDILIEVLNNCGYLMH